MSRRPALLTQAALTLAQAAAPRREFVYFVWDGEFIKIGRTKNLTRRLKAMGTASARELLVLRVVEGGQELEAEMHRKFGRYRVRGEWFHAKQPLVRFVMALPSIECDE